MKTTKNNNLISDEQLLRFSDTIASGGSFDKAFADAGFFLSDKKAYAELQTFAALEGKLNSLKTSINPDAAFAEKLLAKIDTVLIIPAISIANETILGGEMKSPYVGVFDRMLQMAVRPSWKVAAPIAVMFLALSTMLGVTLRRDSSVVLSPETLLTSNNTEPRLAMRSKTFVTNSADEIPSTSTIGGGAAEGRMMLMQTNAQSNVADTTRETLDGVFALLEQELVADLNSSQYADSDMVLDASAMNSLTQPYDETTI